MTFRSALRTAAQLRGWHVKSIAPPLWFGRAMLAYALFAARPSQEGFMTTYNPNANYDIKVWDVEFRKIPTRTLMARIYQPQGPGPFPVMVDFHGGAWNDKNRLAEERLDDNIARSGMLVVAVDLTL